MSLRKNPSRIQVSWAGEHRFDAGRPGGPVIRVDASGATGPGPVDTLLTALATCASTDVVDILAKRRTPVERMTIDVTGQRLDAVPARVAAVLLSYDMTGGGIDRGSAERAIDLAVNKYCSVRSSLDPAIPIEFTLTLNGEAGSRIIAGSLTRPPTANG